MSAHKSCSMPLCVAASHVCLCVRVSIVFSPSVFPEAILNYVSVRSLSPLYFLYCAAALDSVSNSPHAGTLSIPLAPQIFIPASPSPGLWTMLNSCWGQVLKDFTSDRTCRHLHRPYTHNQSNISDCRGQIESLQRASFEGSCTTLGPKKGT